MPLPRLTVGFDKTNSARGYSAYWLATDRRKRYFPTVEERDQEYRVKVALQQFGLGKIETTARHEAVLREMVRLANERGIDSLLNVFRAGLEAMPDHDRPLKEASAEFLEYKQRQVEAGELKENSRGQRAA